MDGTKTYTLHQADGTLVSSHPTWQAASCGWAGHLEVAFMLESNRPVRWDWDGYAWYPSEVTS